MDTPVHSIDTSTSDEVFFPPLGSDGTNVTFRINFQFISGQEYYLLMDSGKFTKQNIKLFFLKNSYVVHCLISQSIYIISQIGLY